MKPLQIIICIFCTLSNVNSAIFANNTNSTDNANFSYWDKSDSLIFESKYKQLLDKGKKDYQMGLELVNELRCDSLQLVPIQIGRLFYIEAQFNRFSLQFEKSISLLEKAIESYKESDKDLNKKLAYTYRALSNNYYQLGKFEKGIASLLKGMDLLEGTDYHYEKSGLFISMGLLYNGLEDFASAEENYLKALKYRKLGGGKNIFVIQSNLGSIYLIQKKYEKSLEYFTLAANNAKADKSDTALLFIYINLSDLKNELGEYDEALEFVNKGKLIIDNVLGEDMKWHLFLAEAKILLNTCIEEIDVQELKNILEITQNSKVLKVAETTADILKKYYHKTNDYKEALFYSEKHSFLEDELNSGDKTIKSATIIANNKHKKQLAFVTAKKNKTIISALISIIILLFLGSTFYLQYKKQKHQTHHISTLLDNEKKSNQSIVENVNTTYKLKLQKFKYAFSDQVYENISTHLHDEIASSIAGIKYGLSGLQLEEANPMIDYSIKHLNKVYSSVRNLSHSVSPLSDDSIDFLQTMKEYFDMSSEIPISVNFTGQSNESVISTHIKSELFRILKELVLNSNKHSGASHIKIVVKLNEDHIYASVEDNGKGIMQNSAGKGLANIRLRVKHLNGQFQLKSYKGTYTKVFIPLIECKGSLVENHQI